MIKKYCNVFLVGFIFLLGLLFLPCLVSASALYDYDFNRQNNEVYLSRYYGDQESEIVIPSEIDGFTVSGIGPGLFMNHQEITRITIPDSIKTINGRAFVGCSALTEISFGKGLSDFSYGIFEGCSSLKKIEVDSENGNFSSMDGVLFSKDGTELIYYPIGKTNASYEIPNGVISISRQAFYQCPTLKSVTLPSVQSIQILAFSECENLETVHFGTGLLSISDDAFSYCSALKEIVIPDSTKSIASSAFEGCTALSEVKLGSNLKTIGEDAFFNCTSLKRIIIPNSVTSVGAFAFSCCEKLEEVTLSNRLTVIESCVFDYNSSLKTINIPDSVKEIKNNAFYQCKSLESIVIPDSVTKIGNRAFSQCTALKEITISYRMKTIGDDTFSGCSSLSDVYYIGSEADKEEMQIDSGNEMFENAVWHYQYEVQEENLARFVEVSYQGEIIVAPISIKNLIVPATLYFAVYDNMGCLIGIEQKYVEAGQEAVTMHFEKKLYLDERYQVKLMLWDENDLPLMRPEKQILIVDYI
ncbi:leucine-rich repeat domain-containing protein [Ructibacterium gallinarum]|uniref:Leucine-rich repeat domain-containing protein n=1 Tax=Ructibacterium gallinarum TaxID=2779355 RepID=A0A9D5R7J3_9FIRM|nr:leucine-rich repeat domain-containing protein [Ructibacterium gallinarum]MBE5039251.1 leucine-rich repeat domain-containing protein [Ructibacterium gallinarum]